MKPLVEDLEATGVQSAWLDGEIVVLGERGVPDFNALQKAFDELKSGSSNAPPSAATESRLRLILLEMIEAVQWSEQKRYLTRQKTREAANRLVWCCPPPIPGMEPAG